MSQSKWIWGGVVCDNERSRQAVHSWFAPMIGDRWGLPVKCDVQEHLDTGAEGSIRALYITPEGDQKEVIRKRLSRSVKYHIRNASPAILAGYQANAA